MMELEYHSFTTPSELMDLGVEHQWLLTIKKRNKADIMCLLIKEHMTLSLAKGIEPESYKAPAPSLQFSGNTKHGGTC